jgi:hypothetical protein
LRLLGDEAVPRYRINPGVVDRLWREDLIEQRGVMIEITDIGRERLKSFERI